MLVFLCVIAKSWLQKEPGQPFFSNKKPKRSHVEVSEWGEGQLVRRAKKTVRYTWKQLFIISLGGIGDPSDCGFRGGH